MKEILVTGGTGYIGSHKVVELINAGYTPIIIDNLVNSSLSVLDRLEQITGVRPIFYQVDVCDQTTLDKVFAKHNFAAVIHFAALKAVGESVAKPLEYYRNNLDSTLSLLTCMQKYAINKLIFSSSATVYGSPETLPLTETARTGAGITNPYGQTKYMIEQILRDVAIANPKLEIITLRYFNPIGAHASGLIGEDPNGIPNNLLPFVAKVAVGELPEIKIFGNDYDTPDGTGVRDYIHVVDLAKGHIAALEHLQAGFDVFNLGTGRGTSVLEIIRAFEKASQTSIPYRIGPRRPGDVASIYANCDKAYKQLNWQAEKTIDQACQDTWKWQNYRRNLDQS